MPSNRFLLLAGGLVALLLVALALWALRDLREPATQSDNLGLQESVEAAVTPGASSSPGGASDSAGITDSLDFTIRDASGRVKEEGRGQ